MYAILCAHFDLAFVLRVKTISVSSKTNHLTMDRLESRDVQ
jgi:hypothetical protein